jgi:hypothetical protein
MCREVVVVVVDVCGVWCVVDAREKMLRFWRPSWKQRTPKPKAEKPATVLRRVMVVVVGIGMVVSRGMSLPRVALCTRWMRTPTARCRAQSRPGGGQRRNHKTAFCGNAVVRLRNGHCAIGPERTLAGKRVWRGSSAGRRRLWAQGTEEAASNCHLCTSTPLQNTSTP